jgi:hypothetical protein
MAMPASPTTASVTINKEIINQTTAAGIASNSNVDTNMAVNDIFDAPLPYFMQPPKWHRQGGGNTAHYVCMISLWLPHTCLV